MHTQSTALGPGFIIKFNFGEINDAIELPFLMALVLGLVTTATAHDHVTGATPAHVFTAGLLHPVTGLDYLITALGFGWWATKRTRSSLSRILFLGMVAIGLWIASYWVIPVSIIDTGIIVSLVLIILAATQRPAVPQPAFAIILPAFSLLYGYAHASALPQGQTAYAFIAGMSVTTIGLLATGSYAAVLCRHSGHAAAWPTNNSRGTRCQGYRRRQPSHETATADRQSVTSTRVIVTFRGGFWAFLGGFRRGKVAEAADKA